MGTFEKVSAFYDAYDGKKQTYGYSETGLPLYAMQVGSGAKTVIVQCAIHAREYVTANVGLQLLKDEWDASVWVLPLTNPDGVKIAEEGTSWLAPSRAKKIQRFARGKDLSLYKANADGVDLNVNFYARWGTGGQNVFSPATEHYVGPFWESAAETKALVSFTKQIYPSATVSLHTKGEVTYWSFYQTGQARLRDYRLAKAFSDASGYPLGNAGLSAGGYKDWCIDALKIPSLTVELGAETLSHPIGWKRAQSLYPPVRKGLRAYIKALTENI